jgi:hypothetical protein
MWRENKTNQTGDGVFFIIKLSCPCSFTLSAREGSTQTHRQASSSAPTSANCSLSLFAHWAHLRRHRLVC